MRLLLVEDDDMIGKAMRSGLRGAGMSVDWVQDGRAAELALANVADDTYALVVLDLGLPKQDGMTLLGRLRRQGRQTPVLIVTARDAIPDRIAGLNSGADDYLVKPFDLGELIARVQAILRRRAGRSTPRIDYGVVSLDPLLRSVSLRGKTVDLSAREFAILEALMQEPGAVVSREALEEAVYGWDEEVASNALEVHLHNLRKKLDADLIKNVRGVGYRVDKLS